MLMEKSMRVAAYGSVFVVLMAAQVTSSERIIDD